jgi:hypothetical protein
MPEMKPMEMEACAEDHTQEKGLECPQRLTFRPILIIAVPESQGSIWGIEKEWAVQVKPSQL